MKKLASAVLFVFLTTIAAPPATVAAQQQTPAAGIESASLQIPVSVENFTGTLTLQRFVVVDGVVNAVGTLVGTAVTPANGTVAVVRNVSLPLLPGTTATCDILHLELGPLDLNLLGLVVHLDKVVLDIEAQSGAGNLLGNLLCGVAGLLDNPGGLVDLLNRILQILG